MADKTIAQLVEDVAPGTTDTIAVNDGTQTRKVQIANLPDVFNIATKPPGTPVEADLIAFADADDSDAVKQAPISALPIAGTQVDIAGMVDKPTPVVGDELLLADGTKATVANLAAVLPIAGTQVNIAAMVDEPTPTVDDELLLADGTKVQIGALVGEFGQMYGTPGSGIVTSVDTTPAAVPAAVYTADGLSSAGVVPDQSAGTITINRAGTYRCRVSLIARRTNPITEIGFALYKVAGDVLQAGVKIEDMRLNVDSDAFAFGGYFAAAAADVFELRADRPLGSSTIELWYASIEVERVGA